MLGLNLLSDFIKLHCAINFSKWLNFKKDNPHSHHRDWKSSVILRNLKEELTFNSTFRGGEETVET
jgi:hypothetical protein